MNFSERLKKAMSWAGYTQIRLSKEIGMAQSSINKLVNGSKGSRKTVEIARTLGVSATWLAEGYGEMLSDNNNSSNLTVHSNSGSYYRVDSFKIDLVAGGHVQSDDEVIDSIKAIEYNKEKAISLFNGRLSDNIKIITVIGDSMAGTINPGDQIFVDVSVKRFCGDGVYVFVFGKTMHVKRLQMVKNELQVISDNIVYRPWSILEEEEFNLKVLAKVLLKQSIDYSRF